MLQLQQLTFSLSLMYVLRGKELACSNLPLGSSDFKIKLYQLKNRLLYFLIQPERVFQSAIEGTT